MKILTFAVLAILAATLITGCASDPGSREFIPGQGWVPN